MRFLFCSLASYGFIGPTIAISLALRRRGHDVACVTDVSMQRVLGQAGIERIPRGPQDGRSFQMELTGHPLDGARQMKHIEYAMQQFAPDVLIGQQLTVGPLVAGRRYNIPLAVLGLAAYIWPTDATAATEWPDDSADYWGTDYSAYVADRYQRFLLSYNINCEMFWLPQSDVSYRENPLNGDLMLLRSISDLEGQEDALPGQVHFVGDCSWGSSPAAPDTAFTAWRERAIASALPILYVQPGRIFEGPGFWKHLTAGLGDQPLWVAASVGRADESIDAIPANFYVRDHIPQEQVLPYASGVICNSTSTAVLGALTHGLPLLLIPGGGGGEQRDLALRCLRAGVALYCSPYQLSSERLRAHLQALLEDTSLQDCARQMQQAFARAGGCERAADLLERLSTQRRPLLRSCS